MQSRRVAYNALGGRAPSASTEPRRHLRAQPTANAVRPPPAATAAMATDKTALFNSTELNSFAIWAFIVPILVMSASKLLMFQPWRKDYAAWRKPYPWPPVMWSIGWMFKAFLTGVAAFLIVNKNMRYEDQGDGSEEVDDSEFDGQKFDFFAASMALHLALQVLQAFWPSVMFRWYGFRLAAFLAVLQLAIGGVVCGLFFALAWVPGMLYAFYLAFMLLEVIISIGIAALNEEPHGSLPAGAAFYADDYEMLRGHTPGPLPVHH